MLTLELYQHLPSSLAEDWGLLESILRKQECRKGVQGLEHGVGQDLPVFFAIE